MIENTVKRDCNVTCSWSSSAVWKAVLLLIPFATKYLSSLEEFLLKESESVDVFDVFRNLKWFLLNSNELKEFSEAWLKLEPESFESSGLANILLRTLPFLLSLGSVLAVMVLSKMCLMIYWTLVYEGYIAVEGI